MSQSQKELEEEKERYVDPAEIYDEEEEEDEVEECLELVRNIRKHTKECDACSSTQDVQPFDMMLQVEFAECFIVLCSHHEELLLQKLLANYIKRKGKGRKLFTLKKSDTLSEVLALEEEEGEESVPSAQERLRGEAE